MLQLVSLVKLVSPKLTTQLGATQSSDGTVDHPVSLHRLLTAVWTQHLGTAESSDCGVNNTRDHYTIVL